MGAGTRTLAAISSEIDWFGLHICYVEAGRVVRWALCVDEGPIYGARKLRR